LNVGELFEQGKEVVYELCIYSNNLLVMQKENLIMMVVDDDDVVVNNYGTWWIQIDLDALGL